jgi:ABC-type dipeptide/oligopeptide/nickel transport system permease component
VLTLPVLLGVVTLVFALIHLIPGDPARAMLGEAASDREVADLRQRLGLDRPLSDQFASYVAGLARADLGTSLRTGTPVTGQIAARVPATAELAVAALLMAVAVALPVGVFAAIRQGRAADRLALAGSLVVVSMPSFWLGPLLAIVFGIQLGWLPVSGRGGPSHLILPAASLGAALAAVLARMTRASLAEQLRQPYVVAAHARGASTSRVVLRHALPNCLVPIVTLLGLQAGALLTGAVITETIFAWPGVGRLLVQAIGFRDYPVVQGCILFIALTYVVVNLATDLIYAALDPRIRYR